MSSCPFCKIALTQAALASGKCPGCGRTLPPDRAAGQPAADDAAGKQGAGPAAKKEIARTLDAGHLDEQPPAEEGGGTADEQRVMETLDAGARGDRPPAEEDVGTADEKQVMKTLDAGKRDERPPAEENGGTAEEKARNEADRRLAETYDSDALPPDVAANLSAMWRDAMQQDVTPRQTIKTDLHSVVADSKLIVQPRVVRGRGEPAKARPDYELMDLLGKGGMGIVYAARQASLDRTVAVKMLRPEKADDKRQWEAFLSEAVVTGDLEHPSIVPIYDLGIGEKDALFYSMKRVKGIAWSEVLAEKPLGENLEILMRVADAIAFAHSKNVIHRDLKPENVMLGGYGEVLLMDWGLAMSLSRRDGSGMGGTPAYMAPEMATGPVERLGVHSDVYLLGAMLFEILTGKTPHAGKNVQLCLMAVSQNVIEPTDQSGELLDIALKAMATRPKDRYDSVQAFQAAIRQYQSHSESNLLAERAERDLGEAKRTDDYKTYARALFGFQEAMALWSGNARAQQGAAEASVAYADSALRKGDYDLGASLLDPAHPAQAELYRKIKAAEEERNARERRLKATKRTALALLLTVLVVVTAAFFIAMHLRGVAEEQRGIAETERLAAEVSEKAAKESEAAAIKAKSEAEEAQQKEAVARKEADTQRAAAVQSEAVAVKAKDAAEEAQKKEEEARIVAETAQAKETVARQEEEYGAYIARIGLIAANIDENAFDRARELLGECPESLRGWEWNRLNYLCTRAFRQFDAEQPVEVVAYAPDGRRFATAGWGPIVRVWDVDNSQRPVSTIDTKAGYVFALAFSPDGDRLAIGSNSRPDYLTIYNVDAGAEVASLRGRDGGPEHTDAVVSAVFSRDGNRLLSSSYDGTAILWDLQTGRSRDFRGHYDTVWSAAFSPKEDRIVTASQDGYVLVWSVETGKAGPPFLGHLGPVYSAAFSPDGRYVVSGGYDKQILIWQPGAVREFDYDSLKNGADAPTPEYRDLMGHTAAVRAVRFSADGKLVLSAGNDNTVRVWDAVTGQQLRDLRGHGGQVASCAFSPDGNWVLSGSHDHTARLWKLEDNKRALVFGGRVLQGHRDDILGAAFSVDGARIVTASRDRTARIWDFAGDGAPLVLREGHEFLASRGVFFPDGKRIVTAAVDGTSRIWNVATGSQLLSIEGTGPSAAVALSHDGTWILTSSDDRAENRAENDRTARIWDVATGQLRRTFGGHRFEVSVVAISPDDRLVFTGDAMGNCRLLNAETGEEIWYASRHSRGVTAAHFLSDGRRIVTASLDGTVVVWDVAAPAVAPPDAAAEKVGHEVLTMRLPNAVTSMAASPDGQRVLVVSIDKTVREFDPGLGRQVDRPISTAVTLWAIEGGKQIRRLPVGEEIVNDVAFSPDGRYAVSTSYREDVPAAGGQPAASAGPQNAVRLWDLTSGTEMGASAGGQGPFLGDAAIRGAAWAAVFSPTGSQVLTIGGNEARLWDLRGVEIMEFSPHDPVASAAFSPDGQRVATAGWDAMIKIWDARTGQSQLRFQTARGADINHVVFSPDGRLLLTASNDRLAELWDVASGKKVGQFAGHDGRVRWAAFSPDGRRVVTASEDKTARIWDVETRETLQVLKGHGEGVLSAAFSPDGQRVITGSEDNGARVWDAQTGAELLRLQGHTSAVASVAFSPDGQRAITGSDDYTAKVWELQTAKEVLTFHGHSEEVTAVAFSPDGKTAMTASRDGTVVLWPTGD